MTADTKLTSNTLRLPVAVAEDASQPLTRVLQSALDLANFAALARPQNGASTVIVLLQLNAFALDEPAVPHRELVEYLVDYLHELGWSRIVLGSTADDSSKWADNRSVAALADLLGYRYETDRGTAYDIADLAEDLADTAFPVDSVLNSARLSLSWLAADFRIVLARCCTDQRETFTLCCATLPYALPETDKECLYAGGAVSSAIAALLEHTPVHFCIVDGWHAIHGSGGRNAPAVADTHAIVCGVDALTVDCVTALKMGADFASSPLLQDLTRRLGDPDISNVLGHATPFVGFRLPDAQIVASTRARESSAFFSHLLAPWLQRIDLTLFPLTHPLDAALQRRFVTLVGNLDQDSAARGLLTLANYLCAALEWILRSYRTLYDKDSLTRSNAPVSRETLLSVPEDYRKMEAGLDALAGWLRQQNSSQDELCWRSVDRAVVFSISRTFPVRFESFIQKVDIARMIQYMNDYLGGTVVPIEKDAQGRPVRQVERNLYLPQPNYLVLSGGLEIDVSKIESVHYEETCHRMYWKTIKSENGSALADDGIVTFAASGTMTRVTIFGRQLFALPLVWEKLNLDLYPELKAHLVEHAYRLFFSRTFSNVEALLQGRQIRLGTARPTDTASARPIEVLMVLVERIGDLVAPYIASWTQASDQQSAPRPMFVDANGFAHFQHSSTRDGATIELNDPLKAKLLELYQGWAEAVGKDVAGAIASFSSSTAK